MMGIKEYARHRGRLSLPGATPAAVRAAIKSGRLATSLTPAGKIKSARLADAEWAASTKADYVPLTGPTAPAATTTTKAPAPAAAPSAAADTGAPPPVNDLAAARARKEAAAADLAEIELAQRRGELVRAKDVEARVADAFLRVRTRLLGLTARLREQDPTLTADQLALHEKLLFEALEELAGSPTQEGR